MASFEQVFGYELAIETAWKGILDDVFLGAISDPITGDDIPICVAIQASDQSLFSPVVEVQLRHVQATGQTRIIGNAWYYSDFKGFLVSRVVTTGGVNSKFHAGIIASVRATAARFDTFFSSANLPYHVVLEMKDYDSPRHAVKESATAPPTDVSEVTYLIQFSVRPDQSIVG